MLKRLAIVLAALFLLVAIGAVLVPSNPTGAECGNLVSPDWTDEQVDDFIDEYSNVMSAGDARNIYENNETCESARSTRTIVAGSAAGLAVVAPLAMFFIGGGRREND